MLTAYIMLTTKHGMLKLVSKQLKKYEQIVELHEIFGIYDIIVKVVVEDVNELKWFIQNKIGITENIKKTHTFIVCDDVKPTTATSSTPSVTDYTTEYIVSDDGQELLE